MAEVVTPQPPPPPPGVVDEDIVKPYKIHIPSKHLDLTRQKLELTRLPHQGAEPQIEPLIDYWLESYSFRETETKLNETITQFRTSIPLSPDSSSLGNNQSIRIHFIHSQSQSSSTSTSTPILLLPPFPLTNLSIYPHIPSDPNQTLIIPSYPGIGFSDSLPASTSLVIKTTAHLFNELMISRLNYTKYIVSVSSSNKIDNLIAQFLVSEYSDTCIGANLINPELKKPSLGGGGNVWEWGKWLLARFFRGGVVGYEEEDFEQNMRNDHEEKGDVELGLGMGLGVPVEGNDGIGETISYALCDSPVGMLAAVVKGLGNREKKLGEEELVTITNLGWLPGPEGAVRFGMGVCQEGMGIKKKKKKGAVGVTVFVGGEKKGGYCPPAWANTEYILCNTQRIKGGGGEGGLMLIFERPEVIFDGVKGLVSGIEKLTARKKEKEKETAAFEGVIIHPATEQEVTTPPGQVIQPPVELSAISSPASGDTAVAGTPSPSGGVDVKGKGKAPVTTGDYLQPPAPIRGDTVSSEGESPDTLVENLLPPLDKA